jgi:histidinol dehydrogenase
VVNDGSGCARHIAADLLSQAEHDELASAVLVTSCDTMAKEVAAEVEKQLALLPRNAIARSSIDEYGAIIVADDLDQVLEFCNRIATEHLELAVDNPFDLLPKVRHAGAIFMGHHTPEALGDYLAGPNHTLPTGGTARFFSPLSLDDFVKKSSLICCSPAGLKRLGPQTVQIAQLEGLDAHARSVSHRLDDDA